MIFLTLLLDSSSVRHKNRNITVLYQVSEYHTLVSYISGGFKLIKKKTNPEK